MPNSHDNIPSILSKNLRALCGLCGEYVTAIPARSTRQVAGGSIKGNREVAGGIRRQERQERR